MISTQYPDKATVSITAGQSPAARGERFLDYFAKHTKYAPDKAASRLVKLLDLARRRPGMTSGFDYSSVSVERRREILRLLCEWRGAPVPACARVTHPTTATDEAER